MSYTENMKKIINMNTDQKFSLAVITLSKRGFGNEDIAELLNVTRSMVGGVMAWHKHRGSWNK